MKEFDQWNEVKKSVHDRPDNFGVHEREIWWVSLGINIGVETDGKHQSIEQNLVYLIQTNENPRLNGFSRRPKP